MTNKELEELGRKRRQQQVLVGRLDSLHRMGAALFGLPWLHMNQEIADIAQDAGLDPRGKRAALALSRIAFHLMTHYEMTPLSRPLWWV